MLQKSHLVLISLLFLGTLGYGQMPAILSLEAEARLRDEWLTERVATILPDLMRREGIDMWLLISREYNEDPVLKTFLPSNWLSARRTTILLLYDNGTTIEALACARYAVGSVFQKAWDKETQPDQWAALAELVKARNPRKIAINRSEHFGLADGLTSFHYEQLQRYLEPTYRDRLVSAERLAIGWLETRLPAELTAYRQVMRIAHEIIAEGFSEQVITPGITTTDEVVWWFRERIRELGFTAWFHPTVDVQRADPGNTESQRSFAGRPATTLIQPGDLLHVDFGITYLGLNTDTQQNAYLLRPGETALPPYLVAAHQQGLRLMDILTAQFKTGRTGNEMLATALGQARKEGLKPSIYSHPIGYHGHGAGPSIGMWDQQDGVPFNGDYPLYPNTAYAIELNNAIFIPEWNKEIRIMLEEDAYFDGKNCAYIDGRQTALYVIPRVLPAHEK